MNSIDAPYRNDPNHPMNPPVPGVRRQIPVDLGNGVIEYLDEDKLVRKETERENDNEIEYAVEYRRPGSDKVVHRSAHVHLKKAMVFGEGNAAAFG